MPGQEPDRQHYLQVARAFDQAAENYDTLYRTNPVMAWLRRESLAVLQATFPPGSRLLEIGCGTGEEALALGRAGYRVVATDISPAMIETARAKAGAGQDNVTWRVLPAGRLAGLLDNHGPDNFDGAYASFGALNCEPDLAPTLEALAHLLRPGAALVCSVMNRWCAWEIAWGLLHLRPRQAFRRLGKGWHDAGLASPEGRLAVPTRYYSPHDLTRLCRPHFRARLVRGLPVLLPPPYLAHLVARHPAFFAGIKKLERHLRDRFPFRAWGDHFLIVLEKA
ncbi:MAG: class I SAM-dependent methyltransferase [Anaerolineae bacterium]|jgi:SAM-dependent methyltransferase